MNRRFKDLMVNIKTSETIPDILINGLTTDSKKVKSGYIFFAVKGKKI